MGKKVKEKFSIGNEGILDARKLGIPRMVLLGIQHTFAMFGATVLVPILTGLPVSTTLLMAGLGTLLFHLLTKGKVPAFLGSSFAFLGGYAVVAPLVDGKPNVEMLPYACAGVACAGLLYVVLAGLIKAFGINRVMRFFPPIVTGPIIIVIGLILAPTALSSCKTNWVLAVIALVIILAFNIWGKGMMKIIPIILGIVGAYAVALILFFVSKENPELMNKLPWLFGAAGTAEDGSVVYSALFNFDNLKNASIIGLPIEKDYFAFKAFTQFNSKTLSAIIAIVPIALATMMEHIGDISAIGATCGKNFIANPGLHRSLLGDGLATTIASLFGGPANTTYGENTGVLALTKVYDPKVVRIAACFSVLLSVFPQVAAVINSVPAAIIGGVSFILYGMISAIGVRNLVENKVDLTKSRNLIIAAVILVSAIGFNAIGGLSFAIGSTTITLSGLAIAAVLGIIINAVLPGNDYKFKKEEPSEEEVKEEAATKA